MARQNVGNPKFYIDLLSYYSIKGIVRGAGIHNNTDSNYHTPGGEGHAANLIDLNPSNYVNKEFQYSPGGYYRVELNNSTDIPF